MKIALHAGLPCTEDDRLLKAFLRNAEVLRVNGTAVPGPSTYRGLLTEVLSHLKGAAPTRGSREVLLDEVLSEDAAHVDRLILSHDKFFAAPRFMFNDGQLYPEAEQRLTHLHELFAGDRVELFLTLRNPAGLIPDLVRTGAVDSLDVLMQGFDPRRLRWFTLIERLRAAHTDMPITVWAYEDMPLIFGEIVRRICDLPTGAKIAGDFIMLSDIMTDEGMRRFRAYLAEHPTLKDAQKRKVMTLFLSKYAREDAISEVIDLPGWTEDLIAEMTDSYEADVDFIATMPDVTVIEV